MSYEGFLYHSSVRNGLTVLEPKRTLSKNSYIGDYVFATADRRMSLMYLVPKGIGAITINMFDGEPYALINGIQQDFERADQGGTIYKVSGSYFHQTPQDELAGTEYVSKVPVPVLSGERFSSSADALRQNGVKLYFFDDETFAKILSAKDHGWAIIRSSRPFIG